MPKPDWFKVKANIGTANEEVLRLIRSLNLHTVCEEANCPNAGECFSQQTATFMLLGNQCTRRCTFCAVGKGLPEKPDPDEPIRIAEAVAQLHLKHVVLTTVTRDDLADGGAQHFALVIQAIRHRIPDQTPAIEVLISDLQGNWDALKVIIDANPEVINHNIETVQRLYPTVRPQAVLARSIELLKQVKDIQPRILTKSGIMVGLGETQEEVLAVMHALRKVGCDLLTIGQYLAPSKAHHPVIAYIHPDQFNDYRQQGEAMGFKHVAAGPLVRSSYHAGEAFEKTIDQT
ncbi:MAG: lipoyl synthase [Eubacteriales bacterium]|nr:lipoyl synthase [Eubacteriales bacterium]